MITATDLELSVGPRRLLTPVSFSVGARDKIGLVGRNGSGKTTLAKVLAGDLAPNGGRIIRSGSIGYLPQDPRTGDLGHLARDRILSAPGPDTGGAEKGEGPLG